MDKQISCEFSRIFLEFLDYLIQVGYGEERSGFIEGIVQRAFFDDWIKFLAYQRKIRGPFETIKKDLLDDK